MGRDTIQLEDAVSTISQAYLLEFTSEYYIPENLHPELRGPEDNIVDFPEVKVGVYTKFFEFANYCIPISQILFDILGYYQIHLSQLSVIGAVKVSHFEINCRVLNIIPTLNLFRVFYTSSFNSGWMSFSKRQGKNTPQCYTKPLDSLKNWNNRFFWVDKRVFPTVVAWRTIAIKDDRPAANTYSAVGLSRNYFLSDDEYPIFLNDNDKKMDLFNLIKASNPTKVKIGTRTPSTVERSPLDFLNEDVPPQMTQDAKARVQGPAVVKQEVPVVDDVETTVIAPEPDLETEDHNAACHEHIAHGGKYLADMSENAEPIIHIHEVQDPSAATQSVSDPDPLSYAKPQPMPKQDVAQSSKGARVAGGQKSEKSTFSPSIGRSPGSIYQLGWGVTNDCHLDPPEACQDMVDHIAPLGYFLELRHLPNNEFLSPYNINLARQVAMASQLRLRFQQEAKLLKKSVAQVARRDQRITTREKHIKDLEALLEVEIGMKKAAEAKNSELAKEPEDLCMRFSGLEVSNAQLSQQAYDPEANDKYVVTLHELNDLKYPLVDQLEQLKDAPLDVIMASLYLESDTGEDAPQFIRDLRPSPSQLKIPVYSEKKKSRVVCRTHRVGLPHHARSDGVPVSVPTVAPQGLQILLADAATQTEVPEDEGSPRLLRSKSLPCMFNLDWP
ncbi:hypothetical protein Tco_0304453 [Tanacetum coccineum]